MVLSRGTHITGDICFPGRGTHMTRDMCVSQAANTYHKGYVFLGRGTHIIKDMCFPGRGTHITRDMCFQVGEHISLRICVSK